MNIELMNNGYIVIRNFIPKSLCKFARSYFKIRQDSLDWMIDPQCPKSKSFYGDPFCETLLASSCKPLSEISGIELIPQYSFTRIYGQGDELKVHLDREECEYSATICLGRPANQPISAIYMCRNEDKTDAAELFLEEGDLCFYKGTEMWHWRTPMQQSWYLQTFLHYVDKTGKYGNRLFDGRFALGVKK